MKIIQLEQNLRVDIVVIDHLRRLERYQSILRPVSDDTAVF